MKLLLAPDLQLAADDRSDGIHHAVGIWKGVDVCVGTRLGDDLVAFHIGAEAARNYRYCNSCSKADSKTCD